MCSGCRGHSRRRRPARAQHEPLPPTARRPHAALHGSLVRFRVSNGSALPVLVDPWCFHVVVFCCCFFGGWGGPSAVGALLSCSLITTFVISFNLPAWCGCMSSPRTQLHHLRPVCRVPRGGLLPLLLLLHHHLPRRLHGCLDLHLRLCCHGPLRRQRFVHRERGRGKESERERSPREIQQESKKAEFFFGGGGLVAEASLKDAEGPTPPCGWAGVEGTGDVG